MATLYDPEQIMAQAREWRQKAAAAVDAVDRDECLRHATRCEWLVRQSIETPSIRDKQ